MKRPNILVMDMSHYNKSHRNSRFLHKRTMCTSFMAHDLTKKELVEILQKIQKVKGEFLIP